MIRLVEVKPGSGYRIWLRYEDGTKGTVELSGLAGRGVFEAWKDRAVFEAVRITEHGAPEWPGGLDLCADALYMRLTGKAPEEVFPTLRAAAVDA
ncbi:MAG: DUF2442 domain-containing protein [Gemmatimonadetes bacterium]|nr:DUF2442 domain-containing protein [Gemmatimonadota bacterium]